jgi:hypothetical protein
MYKLVIMTSDKKGHLSPPESNLGRYMKIQFLRHSGVHTT